MKPIQANFIDGVAGTDRLLSQYQKLRLVPYHEGKIVFLDLIKNLDDKTVFFSNLVSYKTG
jgi:hypothetical protein